MKKISLHMGVIRFDESYYGAGNNLNGCENDVKYFEQLAKNKGFETHLYLSEQATYRTYVDFLEKMGDELEPNDTFMFVVSCHGTYQDDSTEINKRRTAICLHDRIVWDYETKQLLMRFKAGVNVIWVADCCHARDNFKSVEEANNKVKFWDFSNILRAQQPSVPDFDEESEIKCNMIAYTSSTEQQVSYDLQSQVDGRPMGLFTASLEKVMLSPSNQHLNYFQMYRKIAEQMGRSGYAQTPKLQTVNGRKENITFKEFLT